MKKFKEGERRPSGGVLGRNNQRAEKTPGGLGQGR
jgi:hypothetical protein